MKVEADINDGIAVLVLNNPPVNALGWEVRSEILKAVEAMEANADVKVIVIAGAGKLFSAGADIKEFGKPLKEPMLPDLINRIEACRKPVIASIHGNAFGGGLELALGCHFRLALSGSRMGLPEVNIGLLPGAGGTQRMPRLTGLDFACEAVSSGRFISSTEALKFGLIDFVSSLENAFDSGREFARSVLNESVPIKRTSEMTDKIDPNIDNTTKIEKLRERIIKSRRGEIAPLKAIDAVELSTKLPFAEGLKKEREIFLELMNSEQRKGLIHAFMAERKVAKIPELGESKPNRIDSVGVIGGGTMGSGIAVSHLLSGYPVTLVERDEESRRKCLENVSKILDGSVQRGKLKEEDKKGILENRFIVSLDYNSVSQSDLVIEAANEDLSLKCEIFRKLDQTCKSETLLATNTSYLDINLIAKETNRASNVIGLHFFSPAHIMKLVEVVVADKTSSAAVATGFELARKLGKTAVRAGVCEGFIGNRVMSNYRKCAEYMVLDGASPYEIDSAICEFGFPMGIFSVMDLAGLDINWAARKRLAPTRDKRERYPQFTDRICENGWFGRKTGKGYYIYDEDSESAHPNPEVEEIIEKERISEGINKKAFSKDEIIRRYLAAMINESVKVLSDGIALRPSDIDLTMLLGYSFPRWRGGPLHYADSVGLDRIQSDITEFQKEDGYFWKSNGLLDELVESNRNFSSLNN